MSNDVKKMLKGIREFFWPLLEPLNESKPREISETDCLWKEIEEDFILQYVEKYAQSEESRIKIIESKSTIFIGTFGVVIAVLINLTKELIFNNSVTFTFLKLLFIFMISLAILYLCRAIWFSIKVLEKRKYYTLGFPNFFLNENTNKKKQIIIKQYNNTKKNQIETNIKIDFMTMAQEYFKRAIVVVAIFSIIVFVNYTVYCMPLVKNLLAIIKIVNLAIIIGMLIVLIVLSIQVIILTKKIKILKKSEK